MKLVKTEVLEWGIKFTFADGSYCEKHYSGDEYWYNANGKRHRDNDKPAVVEINGQKEWWVNDEIHRENDKPAIIWADGTKIWLDKGKLHRDNDQPAKIYANGAKEWWIKNKNIKKEYPGG